MTTPIIVATPASATANSYCTKAEADTYFSERLSLTTPWEDADTPEAALIMASRLLDGFFTWTGDAATQRQSSRLPRYAFFTWTGAPSTAEQALCWPRQGMYSRNGYLIASGEIPNALKNATAELAGQLLIADRTVDNDIEAMGITSLKAGPVSLSFKDMVENKVMPDAVLLLLVPSWYVKNAVPSLFEML
jgi:hypothetical protein